MKRSLTALACVTALTMAFAVTAQASTEGVPPPTLEESGSTDALTPGGNLTLLDDLEG